MPITISDNGSEIIINASNVRWDALEDGRTVTVGNTSIGYNTGGTGYMISNLTSGTNFLCDGITTDPDNSKIEFLSQGTPIGAMSDDGTLTLYN